jgi:hypothetical protein
MVLMRFIMMNRQPRLDQFLIQHPPIRQDHIPDDPTIRVMAECFHGHILAQNELGRELFGALPERLPFLRTIN